MDTAFSCVKEEKWAFAGGVENSLLSGSRKFTAEEYHCPRHCYGRRCQRHGRRYHRRCSGHQHGQELACSREAKETNATAISRQINDFLSTRNHFPEPIAEPPTHVALLFNRATTNYDISTPYRFCAHQAVMVSVIPYSVPNIPFNSHVIDLLEPVVRLIHTDSNLMSKADDIRRCH